MSHLKKILIVFVFFFSCESKWILLQPENSLYLLDDQQNMVPYEISENSFFIQDSHMTEQEKVEKFGDQSQNTRVYNIYFRPLSNGWLFLRKDSSLDKKVKHGDYAFYFDNFNFGVYLGHFSFLADGNDEFHPEKLDILNALNHPLSSQSKASAYLTQTLKLPLYKSDLEPEHLQDALMNHKKILESVKSYSDQGIIRYLGKQFVEFSLFLSDGEKESDREKMINSLFKSIVNHALSSTDLQPIGDTSQQEKFIKEVLDFADKISEQNKTYYQNKESMIDKQSFIDTAINYLSSLEKKFGNGHGLHRTAWI